MDIYFFNYNNYFLRKVKIKEDLNGFLHRSLNVNFNENDGVNASVVMGVNGNPYENKNLPDYAIVADSNEIVSRWFVLECIKNRNNQYTCKLRRDLLADFNDKILESVSYIEKGYTGEFSLNCIPEEVRFNQIKKGEYLLKNSLGVPWIVCYLPRYDGSGQRLSFSGTAEVAASADYSEETYPYEPYIDKKVFYGEINAISIIYKENYEDGATPKYKKMILSSAGARYETLGEYPPTGFAGFETYLRNPAYDLLNFVEAEEAWNKIYALYNEDPSLYINGAISKEKAVELKGQEGKILEEIASGDLGEVHVSTENVYSSEEISSNSNGGKKIAEVLYDVSFNFPNPERAAAYNMSITKLGEEIELSLTDIPRSTSVEYNINYDTAESPFTTDAPYEIVAFPYGEASVITPRRPNEIKTNKNISLAVAQALMKGNAITDSNGVTTISNKAYDVQILPYIQYDDWTEAFGALYVPNYELVIEIKEGSELVGWGLKLTRSAFSKIIQNQDIPIRSDVKKSVVLDKYRLVSPNGVGEYEFSFAKNRGNKGFEADITLSPINPYIKINPIFDGLYGSDFNDFRGLICAGDFSIPYVTNSWIDYQLQNKNFAANFKNQLRSNDVAYTAAVAQRVNSTITSLAHGAMSGSFGLDDFISGGIAAAGTVASEVISGITYKTQRDISIQNFTAAMESVQALPETLGKTTPFNNNNKYFPYIEYYTCSEHAEQLFDNQLKYGGQTLKIIGKIKDYYNAGKSYIKAYVIDSEIEEDSHVLEAINAELAQGVRYDF